MKMNSFLSAIFAALVCFFSTASISYSQEVVKVGVHDAWPLVAQNSEGEYEGFAIDILRSVAEKHKWTLELVPGHWAELSQQLEDKELDFLFPYSNQQSDLLDKLPSPLAVAWGGLFVREADELRSILLVEGLTIAALENDLFGLEFGKLTESLGIHVNFVYGLSTSETFEMVRDGKADAASVEALDGSFRAADYGLHMTAIRYKHITGHFAIAKEHRPELAAILESELVSLRSDADSEYYKSYNKWYEPVLKMTYPKWIDSVLHSVLGAIAILLGFLIYQRYKYSKLRGRAHDLTTDIERQKKNLLDLQSSFKSQINSLKSAGDRIRQSQKMESVGQLTGGVAHDFNNVLGIILGNLELAKDKVTGNLPVEKFINDAISATEQGSQLTQCLLEFSSVHPWAPRVINVASTLAELRELLNRTLGDSISVDVQLNEPLWLLKVDPSQLHTSILNLALNARYAMQDGGKLTIEASNVVIDDEFSYTYELKNGHYVQLSFSDTGIGFDPDGIDRAMEPFYTTKPMGKGTGLGLSIVYGFAQQSGGCLIIDRQRQLGARVSIYLPQAVEKIQADVRTQTEAPSHHRGQGERVLIVEDEVEFCKIVASMTEGLGYSCVTANCGAEALKILASDEQIDLMLSDINLPGGFNGSDIADVMAKSYPSIPIIFMTGYSEELDRYAQHFPNSPVLTKPFGKNSLSELLRAAISVSDKKLACDEA